jgi:hypothetical protein
MRIPVFRALTWRRAARLCVNGETLTAEVAACFPVMALLRPHLSGVEEFVTRVARQHAAGYRLLAAWRDAVQLGIAGYRFEENLIRGKFFPFLFLNPLMRLGSGPTEVCTPDSLRQRRADLFALV